MSRLRRLACFLCGGKALLHCAVLCLIGVVLLSTTLVEQTRSQAPSRVQQRVQPLDPLTPDEETLAAQVAGSDPRVKEALGRGRQQLIRVEFLALKTPAYRETTEPAQLRLGRHAAVIYYRYDTDQGVHVVVDLGRKSVGGITMLEGKTVPLAAAEVVEASGLALRDERVRALLGPRADEFKVALSVRDRAENRVEGLRIVATSPGDTCYRHRCVELIFRRREGYLAGTSVTVDLTAQAVRVERSGR